MQNKIDECPKCKADLTGVPIPEEHKQYFGDATHFSRRISIYDLKRDRTTKYKCPDCGHEWSRI